MLVTLTFHYVDKNGDPQSLSGQTRHTFYGDYYRKTEYLQKRAYMTYKGLPGGIEFHDVLPPWDWYLNH